MYEALYYVSMHENIVERLMSKDERKKKFTCLI